MLKRLIILLCLLAPAVQAQTRYVSDSFEVMLRSGPSTKNKIVKVLKSGNELTILREDSGNGYSQVQTSNGTIGYVLTRYLSNNPSSKRRVAYLQRKLEQLSSKPDELRTLLANRQEENQQLIAQNVDLSERYATTKSDLDDLNRVSGSAIKLSEKNNKLESEVQQLLLQLDDVRIQNETLKDQSDKKWFLLGGSAVLLGVILGWLLTIARRQRRPSSWGGM